jgi:hypothetical protein
MLASRKCLFDSGWQSYFKLVLMLVLMKYNTRPVRPNTSTLALIQHVAGKERLEVRYAG